MPLTDFLSTMKAENRVVNRLEQYLLLKSYSRDGDRRWDINSPSMTGGCARRVYLSRTQLTGDSSNTPRGVRILDNGTHVHLRLEKYLLDSHIALIDEIPVINDVLEIQGHADLIISLVADQTLELEADEENRTIKSVDTASLSEVAVGEIKSINSRGFSQLKDAKPEHKAQAMCYLYSMEERRRYLRKECPNMQALLSYLNSKEYDFRMDTKYGYLTDGNNYTAEQKFNHKVTHYKKVDVLLYLLDAPITKMIFLYECKDTQALKEFTVCVDDSLTTDMIDFMQEVNQHVHQFNVKHRQSLLRNKGKKLSEENVARIRVDESPKKKGTSKSCDVCRWCGFKSHCWIM